MEIFICWVKEKVEDNIMRVKDKKIAAELLELAFK